MRAIRYDPVNTNVTAARSDMSQSAMRAIRYDLMASFIGPICVAIVKSQSAMRAIRYDHTTYKNNYKTPYTKKVAIRYACNKI